MGDRSANMRAAVERLNSEPGIAVTRVSHVYETAPVGGVEQPDYYNAAIEIETDLEPGALLGACLSIEQELGRVRAEKWGPRVIDIDILLYADSIIDTPDLIVPHPLMAERVFVLYPLAGIAPDAVHPLLGISLGELRSRAGDAGIKKLHGVKLD
jgi:2-amino-4-hydroxy-6-hydroxymethyldihydropteridine diphosphokinase